MQIIMRIIYPKDFFEIFLILSCINLFKMDYYCENL